MACQQQTAKLVALPFSSHLSRPFNPDSPPFAEPDVSVQPVMFEKAVPIGQTGFGATSAFYAQ